MKKEAKIYVAGHNGLVGSSIKRQLENQGYRQIIGRSSSELELRNQLEVFQFFQTEKPDYVFMAAAKVGGILENHSKPASFIYDNLMIETNVIHAAYEHNVQKLLFLGSSCIYPKLAPQPIKEGHLLTGKLEPTNEPYAIAKIAGIKLCSSYNRQYGTDYLAVMPTNLYGIHDNFDLSSSHVLPALIRKFHEAKVSGLDHVEVWGTGQPKREFLYVDDLADACIYLMQNYHAKDIGEFVNIGTGVDITIAELADLIKVIVGYQGEVIFNKEKPDGTPRKLLDVSKMSSLGWNSKVRLEEGIRTTYEWYKSHISKVGD